MILFFTQSVRASNLTNLTPSSFSYIKVITTINIIGDRERQREGDREMEKERTEKGRGKTEDRSVNNW